MSQFASNRAQALPRAAPYSTVEHAAGWLLATLTRPDVVVVLSFCAIGLLLTFAALATSPDFASVLAQESAMP
jgi:hypothetical protein